jgi:hypothetical protein
MIIWQVDIYQNPLQDKNRGLEWQLLICDTQGTIIHQGSSFQVSSDWLISQLQIASKNSSPSIIRVFRPQTLAMLTPVTKQLGISLQGTRRTYPLKRHLQQRQIKIKLEQSPPQSLPANLWGEQWRFATFAAAEMIEFFQERPLPIIGIETELLPLNLGLASTAAIPGLVIYGGKQSMRLARWVDAQNPVSIHYIAQEVGKSGGLVLESSLIDRWILATFEDSEVAEAAQRYETRKQESKELHFLVVQPDDSGMTYTGFWLLKTEL